MSQQILDGHEKKALAVLCLSATQHLSMLTRETETDDYGIC